MDIKGYYKILGVSENASDDEIKKAYRSGAVKWHPDRWVNGTDEEKKTAEDKFKQLNEAYSVLSDKQKRQAYDSGMDGNFQQFNGDFDPFEVFRRHFGGKNPFGDFFGGFGNDNDFGRQNVQRGDDVDVSLELTMEEANSSVSKTITYELKEKCEHCNGTGLGKDGKIDTCPHCNGTGVVKNVQQMGFTTIVTQSACPYCGGSGKTVKNPCKHCGGTGFSNRKRKENVTINIPTGIAPGETLVLRGYGEQPNGGNGERGDLRIHISIKLPEGYNFTNNLGGVEYQMEIPFYDAMLGCEKEVLFPSGKKRKIKIEMNTKNGKRYSYRNEGMKLKDGSARASFDVVVNYTIPQQLSKKQEDILKEFKNITENGD